jgi:hypothetical protein
MMKAVIAADKIMPDLDIKDAILMREFKLRSGGEIRIYFWKPVYCSDVPEEGAHEHYKCYFQIIGIDNDKTRRVVGVDSIQALMLALQAAGLYLYTSNLYESGELTYLGYRDLCLSLSDGTRIDKEGYEKADVLTSPGGNTIIQLPDDRFASVVFEGIHLNSLVRRLSDVIKLMEAGDQNAMDELRTLSKGLANIEDYYEAVCRREKLHLPYVK